MIKQSREYNEISTYYGSCVANRSQVPLMNHINEGLEILTSLGAEDVALKAWCLHPIVQVDTGIDTSWSDAYPLADEYKVAANSYLCRPDTDHLGIPFVSRIIQDISRDCALMLLTDKIQNQKDFLIYNRNHPRAEQLQTYFSNWLSALANNIPVD